MYNKSILDRVFSLIEEFSLTALTCPFGPKLKIYVENWAEELSVLSTLWSLSLSSFLLSSDAHNTHDKFFTTTTKTFWNFSKLRHYSTDPKKCSALCIRTQKSILFDMEFLNLISFIKEIGYLNQCISCD